MRPGLDRRGGTGAGAGGRSRPPRAGTHTFHILSSPFFLGLVVSLRVTAAEPAVRTALAVEGDIWVGGRVPIVVELLSPGFFTGSPAFDLPRVPGAILIKPDERPVLGTETIDGASYTVQRHELAVYAQRAGRIEIPPFPVRFATREGSAAPVPCRRETPSVSFEARLPPGAEGLNTLISARELEVTESWEPEPGAAKVGDAFTRTIRFAAEDVPAMVFPPFPASPLDGFGVYAKEPQVRDRVERGRQRGERLETITYVCERAGQFRLPAARLVWWDLDDALLRTVELPARRFDVAPDPALALSADGSGVYAAVLLGLGVWGLAVVVWRARSRWSRWWWRFVALWRPTHLAPLNPPGPGERSGRGTGCAPRT